MRHVSDGELHAYLDGALDLLDEARGQEVREHLASCPVCRERLQDEKGILEESQGLLALSAPEPVALPPFEELRAMAEAGNGLSGTENGNQEALARYRGPIRGVPLAWAATVILALGVGWMGGEIWRARSPGDLPEYAPAETRAEQASDVSVPGVARPVTTPPPTHEGVAEEEAPAARSRSGLVGGLEEKSARGAGPDDALLDAPELSPPPSPSVGLAEDLVQENSLAVPGFEVISVQWEEWVPGERGLHIRQLLPMGDTLELRYLGMLMGADAEPSGKDLSGTGASSLERRELPPLPSALEVSLPPGWNQVVMKKARGWLVARAPLSETALRALLRSLR